jgi:hypothetical protein
LAANEFHILFGMSPSTPELVLPQADSMIAATANAAKRANAPALRLSAVRPEPRSIDNQPRAPAMYRAGPDRAIR